MLHAGIDAILHFPAPGLGQDGAISKCARAKLGSPLEPTDDLASGDVPGHAVVNNSSSPICRYFPQGALLISASGHPRREGMSELRIP